MSTGPPETKELLIVSLTPQNLERGVLWFSENLAAIKKARYTNPWWHDNAFFVEKDLVMQPAELARRLTELGYERTQTVRGRGLFAVHGGITEVWPINTEKPYLIEFTGNTVELVKERPETKEVIEVRPPYYRGRSIAHLPAGSFAVHVDHGIGIFRGTADNYFLVEYAPPATGKQPDMLYVPVGQTDRLAPYVGFTTPAIHRLGGMVWFKTKRKAREDAEKLARELLELYAQRHQAERAPHSGDKELESKMRETFLYTETEDQLRAEEEIYKDLSRSQPMDRVLCGDVGFGKTEVAIRAALRVIASGRQVAVLAPTTILAAQHEKTFRERLSNGLPVTIAALSRLAPPQDERQTLQGLAEGKIDCVIGTHRLLSRDIAFKNLGLLIIDEEQRFGVKQKEHFKNLRSEIDILSLSATPIPRTLSLALAKLRDISVIETPPPERLPIQTFVLPYSLKTVARAIRHELKRGGQVYFLHNRIETLGRVKEKLSKALYQAKLGTRTKLSLVQIGIIHGRMKEEEVIRAMDQFRAGVTKILLATTIIENGLDISNANTLIVDEATHLGLSEAHQLRGRIGRGNVQAFAYFLYRPRRLIPRSSRAGTPATKRRLGAEKAEERLETLKEYSDLGSGYQIALRDLEIRGAGNILGREQSGAINKVGLNLYCQMLADAVEPVKR